MESTNGKKFQRGYEAKPREIRRLRTRARMSLKALEERSGVNYTTINRIERGHNRSPQWPTLENLAEALGVDVEQIVEFLDGEDDGVTSENRAHAERAIAQEKERHRGKERNRADGS